MLSIRSVDHSINMSTYDIGNMKPDLYRFTNGIY